MCNCDSTGYNNIDEGVLTDRDQLPVRELAYGNGAGVYNALSYMVGHLECTGKDPKSVYPSKIDTVDYYYKYYSSSYVHMENCILFLKCI